MLEFIIAHPWLSLLAYCAIINLFLTYKGRDGWLWYFGCVLFPILLLIILFLEPLRRCPHCREHHYRGARICPKCQTTLKP
jgi:hypothetical protein